MKNLDELTQNRKMLDSTGRSELLEIINVLLDERAVLVAGLQNRNPILDRRHKQEDAYLNEAEHMLANDYQGLHDAFDGAQIIDSENPETD